MAVLKWDETGKRLYETGIEQCALYVYDTSTEEYSTTSSYNVGDVVIYNGKKYRCKTASTTGAWDASKWDETMRYNSGVAWNGITALTESPSGAEETALYADDTKYLSLRSAEEFGATIEAYTYPDEFAECDGVSAITVGGQAGLYVSQQTRKSFCLSYVTKEGNDTEADNYGYKIHLIYGCTAAPSERAYATVNDSPEAITFSWEVKTVPVETTINNVEYKKTAHLEIDASKYITISGSTKTKSAGLLALENALHGTANAAPYIPSPAEVYTLLSTAVAG